MKKIIPWVIGLSLTLVTALGYWVNPSVLNRVELLFQNMHFQWRGPIPAGPEVVIAAIDEKSIDELGRWPWPRDVLASLVEKLVEHEVKAIGFDMVFSSPDESTGRKSLNKIKEKLKENIEDGPLVDRLMDPLIQEADNDARFASALKASRRSVLGYFFHFTSEDVKHLSPEEKHFHFQNARPSRFSGFIKEDAGLDLSSVDFRSAYAVESNIPILSKNSRRAGFISFDVESDGTLRKLPVIVKYHDSVTQQDYFFPPLSIRVLEKYLKGSLFFRVGEFGPEKVILDGKKSIEIPVNSKGEMLVNFLGSRGTFPHVSITDILHDRKDFVSEGSLKDKIVLVGATATALGDIKVTPFDPVYPGVEIQGTIIDNILHNRLLYQPGWIPTFNLVTLVLSGILLTFIYSRLKPVFGVVIFFAIAGGQLSLSQWIFVNKGLWITDAFPLMENALIFFSLTIYGYMTERKQKQFVQNIFGKYVSPTVVNKLLQGQNELKLGGEEKELTALFTDLAGFTTFSEKMSAEELVNLLNDYLTEMTEVLLRHEGTLDKYDGDAIKAFFGAPVYFNDHAKRACFVAIEMQERLGELREKWLKEGRPELFMRIGVNTGQMVVGNLGSKNRMSYGMNGDSVNLAARLEGVNKEYETFTLISETTFEQAKDFIEAREVDTIRVVGRSTPVRIYELLGKKGSMDERVRGILTFYNEGLQFYKEAKWDEAADCFGRVLKIRPEDGPSSTLLKRCQLLKKSYLVKKDWDGVYSMSSK